MGTLLTPNQEWWADKSYLVADLYRNKRGGIAAVNKKYHQLFMMFYIYRLLNIYFVYPFFRNLQKYFWVIIILWEGKVTFGKYLHLHRMMLRGGELTAPAYAVARLRRSYEY